MYWGVMSGQMGWGVMEEEGWRKGPWTAEEDRLLIEYVRVHGEGRWNSVARLAGLKRNGKSCRLRWVNYLRPDLKRGQITPHEESIILELHARWGNRWSTIARSLPGRTDNEIKNYWRTHFKKKQANKACADTSSEKAKARLLKRQHFHQQQQQLQQQQEIQQQQQQQQFQLNQMDLKRIMALLDDAEQKPGHNPGFSGAFHQPVDEQGFFYSVPATNNGHVVSSALGETSITSVNNEEAVWDYGLWSLEDFHGNNNNNNNNGFNNGQACLSATKAGNMQNLVVPFCS